MPCPSGVDSKKWAEVRPKVKAQYPDYSDERIDKITAGVIHKQGNNPKPKDNSKSNSDPQSIIIKNTYFDLVHLTKNIGIRGLGKPIEDIRKDFEV